MSDSTMDTGLTVPDYFSKIPDTVAVVAALAAYPLINKNNARLTFTICFIGNSP